MVRTRNESETILHKFDLLINNLLESILPWSLDINLKKRRAWRTPSL